MDPVEYEMLRHMWFPVARVADLGNGVTSGNILGEELVVYGDGRSVTVAEGFCPHRGVALRLGHPVPGPRGPAVRAAVRRRCQDGPLTDEPCSRNVQRPACPPRGGQAGASANLLWWC
ncbi:hypothetical protein GCM10010207_71730 [Streptomyces atratus]|nr:hypothetical protein GCM10010207_71730 [Streptomyces atratus]